VATSYYALGRHAEALKLSEGTLALRRAKLGPDHPDTLASMNNVATSYYALGRHAEALKHYEEALALQQVKLGPDHPGTLVSAWGAIDTLMALRRSAEALPRIDALLARADQPAAAGQGVDPRLGPAMIYYRLRIHQEAKDAAGCRATAERWEQRKRSDAESLYLAACWRAVTAAVQAQTPGADAAKQAAADADRAMTWLKQAVAAGYKNAAHMEKDNDLAFLRDRPDFQELLAGLKK
jgi:tetratricopeptide (TPR) repeat protein